jgi:tripartite-type tricarboxylate transporter receptor subunit TctC
VRSRFTDNGADPVGSSPEAFAEYFRKEMAKWARTVKTAGIRIE